MSKAGLECSLKGSQLTDSSAHHVKDVLVLGLFSVSIAVAAIRLSPKMGCQIYARIVMRMV